MAGDFKANLLECEESQREEHSSKMEEVLTGTEAENTDVPMKMNALVSGMSNKGRRDEAVEKLRQSWMTA